MKLVVRKEGSKEFRTCTKIVATKVSARFGLKEVMVTFWSGAGEHAPSPASMVVGAFCSFLFFYFSSSSFSLPFFELGVMSAYIRSASGRGQGGSLSLYFPFPALCFLHLLLGGNVFNEHGEATRKGFSIPMGCSRSKCQLLPLVWV